MTRYIDLSHTIFDGLVTYPGLPAPIVCDYFSRKESKQKYDLGETFQIAKIEMVANTGTYIDVPFHRFASGADLAQTPLDCMANLSAVVVRANGQRCVEASEFWDLDLEDKAVLIQTGWSQYWGTSKYLSHNPFLATEAATYLRDGGVKLVGIDSLNIDDTTSNARPVHTTLLESGILIVEHLCNLDTLPDSPFRFSAIPPKITGVGSFPVRAFAQIG